MSTSIEMQGVPSAIQRAASTNRPGKLPDAAVGYVDGAAARTAGGVLSDVAAWRRARLPSHFKGATLAFWHILSATTCHNSVRMPAACPGVASQEFICMENKNG